MPSLFKGPCQEKKILRTKINRPEVFCKKDVLKNIVKFTGKHPLWSLFFNKVAGLKLISLCNCKIFKSTFFYSGHPVAVSEERLFNLFGTLRDKFSWTILGQPSLREKWPYSELFWSVFFRIRTEYGEIRTRITPNTDTFYTVSFFVFYLPYVIIPVITSKRVNFIMMWPADVMWMICVKLIFYMLPMTNSLTVS